MRISLEEAVELIKKNIITKQCENIFIGDGLGRVLSDDIYACLLYTSFYWMNMKINRLYL